MTARRFLLPPLLCAALLSAGCSHSYKRDWVQPAFKAETSGRVAVLPLENHSEYPHAGETISELLTTELRLRGFAVLDGHVIRRTLKLKPDDEGRSLSDADLRALGKQLKVDSVVAGSVGEFRYKRDLGEDPVVGFSIRMIRVSDGRVLWSSSHSRTEYGLLYHRHYLHENAQRIAECMVDFLMDEAAQEDPLETTGASEEAPAEEPAKEAPAKEAPVKKAPAKKAPAKKAPAKKAGKAKTSGKAKGPK